MSLSLMDFGRTIFGPVEDIVQAHRLLGRTQTCARYVCRAHTYSFACTHTHTHTHSTAQREILLTIITKIHHLSYDKHCCCFSGPKMSIV